MESCIERIGDGFIGVPTAPEEVRYPPGESWKQPIDLSLRTEFRAAIVDVVTDDVTVGQDEFERAVRTVFGFRRLGPKIATAIQSAIRSLVKDATLAKDEAGRYRLT